LGGSGLRLLIIVAGALALAVGLGVGSTAESQGWDARSVALQFAAERQQQRGIAPSVASNDVVSVRESLGGSVHVRLQHRLHGVRVAGADSTASMRPGDAAPRFVSGRGLASQRVNARRAAITLSDASAIAHADVGVTGPLRGTARADLTYVDAGDEYVLAYEVIIPALTPLGTWVVYVDATTGAVLARRNAFAYDSGQVFDPNPFQTSGGAVPPPSDCDSAGNGTTLSAHESTVTLLGIQAAQNKLKGQYVDLTAPGIVGGYKAAGQANEAARIYNYNCNDDRFEEVMVYHHIDATQRKIQSLGFSGPYAILDGPIPAHAHFYADCNAHYDPFNLGIHFGDGIVATTCLADAGEDGDIIVHEYGHAIQDNTVPGWGLLGVPTEGYDPVEQALSIGEGFGDFIAAVIFNDDCLGGWGLITGTCLRTVENTKVYPTDFDACPNILPPDNIEEPHCGGEVWSATLWDLVQALGGDQAARDIVLRLVLNSHFFLSPQATFAENAQAILLSDTDLYGGAHMSTLNAAFVARGITPDATIVDENYLHILIRHPTPGDLEVRLKVASLASPTCEEFIYDNFPSVFPDLILIGSSACPGTPSVGTPWYVEVRDTDFDANVGSVAVFAWNLAGSDTMCFADNTPLAIPAGNVAVAAVNTCQNTQSAQQFDSDGDTIPDIFEVQYPCMDRFANDAALDDDGDTLNNAAEFAAGTNPCLQDTDGDNCNDNKELGLNQLLGGDRSPLSPWDFFDVPTPALTASNSTGTRNKLVSLADVLAVVAYVGTALNGPANANGADYDTDRNGNGIIDGFEYDRTPSSDPLKPWRSGAPSNLVTLSDALVALAQVGHNCS